MENIKMFEMKQMNETTNSSKIHKHFMASFFLEQNIA